MSRPIRIRPPRPNQILTGDCRRLLPRLRPGSARLAVTSPPYPGLRGNGQSVGGWLGWFDAVLAALLPALAADGLLALNLSFRRREGWFDGRLFTRVPALLAARGLRLVDVYAWDKLNPVPAGNLRRHDIPAWEPVFLTARVRDYPFFPVRAPYGQKTLAKLRPGNAARARDRYGGGHSRAHPAGARQPNVLRLSPSGEGERPRARGGSFPLALPARFIAQHTRPGDLVLDPFCGVGTTCVAARRLGRSFLGIELDPAEADRARAWLAAIERREGERDGS